MAKVPKWKVNVQIQEFYTVEVEAATEEIAVEMAYHEIEKDPEYHSTSSSANVTSVFLNDREARDFHLYIPEGRSQLKEECKD